MLFRMGVPEQQSIFSKVKSMKINESTIRAMKAQSCSSDGVIDVLPGMKRGAPFKVGSDIDNELRVYIKKLCEVGQSQSIETNLLINI